MRGAAGAGVRSVLLMVLNAAVNHSEHDAEMEQLGLETTARLKTINTIVEKLRREKTRLAEMQDVAGLRLVKWASQSRMSS